MGELHLEVIAHRIERDKGVEITTTPPIVVYRETIRNKAGPVEGKSPNRHNRFYVEIEPLEQEVIELIRNGDISMNLPELERREKLMAAGMNKDEAKGIVDIYESNIYIDMTKGIQYLNETMELILEGYQEVMKAGPLSREPCMGQASGCKAARRRCPQGTCSGNSCFKTGHTGSYAYGWRYTP